MVGYYPKDFYGRLKQDYLDKLSHLSDDELRKEVNKFIWLSAYASNNPRSDFHWQADVCYDECKRRDKVSIYEEEHYKLSHS